MKLIHIQGNNCYLDCVITLANALGLDYLSSFSTLWAESELRYDSICQVFLTRRLFSSLEAMGMKLEDPRVTREEKEAAWPKIPTGGYAIIGMGAYLTPWAPLYQLQNGPHYFILRKDGADFSTCFDPTYEKNGEELPLSVPTHAYALIPVIGAPPALPANTANPPSRQAQELLETHSATLESIIAQTDAWVHGTGNTALLPAKLADALLANRVLYRHFLEQRYPDHIALRLFQNPRYFEAWRAVKHGFYKAALSKHREEAFDETCKRLTGLFQEEIGFAQQIIAANV